MRFRDFVFGRTDKKMEFDMLQRENQVGQPGPTAHQPESRQAEAERGTHEDPEVPRAGEEPSKLETAEPVHGTEKPPVDLEQGAESPKQNAEALEQKGSEQEDLEQKDLEQRIVESLETVFDPEIPVSIYALGLIYSVEPQDSGHIEVKMTLTSPHCPVAESLPGEVRLAVEKVDGVASASVEIVWDPPWTPDMMSEAAKLELGMF